MKILVMNGPNLNMTGIREKHLYGNQSLEEINLRLNEVGEQRGHDMVFYQSNHEGDIIDQFHKMYFENNVDGVIYNPGSHVHYSYAIKDAIIASARPVIEVHISNLYKRVLTVRRVQKNFCHSSCLCWLYSRSRCYWLYPCDSGIGRSYKEQIICKS